MRDLETSSAQGSDADEILLYNEAPPSEVAYVVSPAYVFDDDQRAELERVLDVRCNPYSDYPAFHAEIIELVDRRKIPGFLFDLGRELGQRDLREAPVIHLKNCPVGEVPYLDFDDQRRSKHALKKSFVPEAFLAVFAQLRGTPIITYRTANDGDMFHDLHPMRALQYSMSQKTVNTLAFHTDLGDNRVRPDWVNLVALRNSPKNEVLNSFVRFSDVLARLDPAVIEVLRRPIFHSPRTRVEKDISIYGDKQLGFLDSKPVLTGERGSECFFYNEDFQTSESEEGLRALAAVRAVTQPLRASVFCEERDLLSFCNNTCFHARHVVRIDDLEAHQHRWLLKTWNVDDLEPHRRHFVPGLMNTVDE